MAVKTQAQILLESNATYFDNVSGSITPQTVRDLNQDWIDSTFFLDQTGSITVASASNSANSIATASVVDSTITFTKGNGSSFNITIAQSGSIASASYATFAETARVAVTASYANQFNVALGLTASGLRYPTTDGLEGQVLKTDGTNDLAFGDVNTMYETVYTGENITKSDPLYISGSQGANPIVYKADAANAAKMPVTYIASETIAAGNTTRGIVLGLIEGINLTGYVAGTEVYVAAGGGWTSTRPTGSAIVQVLGIVTKGGNGGKGLVLNPGPVNLPNLTLANTWVGNASGVPVATPVASLTVAAAGFASNANLLDNLDSSVFVQTGSYNNFSSSIASRTSTIETTYATTGSNTFTGINRFNIISASFASVLSASIDYLSVVYQTSSVIFSSGSNIFGDNANDTQTLWGTVNVVTGPLLVTGSVRSSGGFTGSLLGNASTATSATTATTASFALNAATASFVTTAQTASFVTTAQTASFVTTAQTASSVSTLVQPVVVSGSLRGSVVSASIASNTASIDLSQGNFFTCLVSGSTNFNVTNVRPGQTANILLTTVGIATASFSSNVDQPSGSAYTPTSGSGRFDVLTVLSFDGSIAFLANVKNLI